MRLRRDENSDLDALREELHQLERRVCELEHHAPEQRGVPAVLTAPEIAAAPGFALPNATAVAGRAILGLAGAYLLRALAEGGGVARGIVVAIAIVYAAGWIIFSVRAHEDDAFAGSAYGITGAFILAPLLWEATTRFNVLTPAATAGILIAFTLLVAAIAWSRDPGVVTSVITLSTALTSLGLMIRTGDMAPFAASLLVTACAVELAACRGHGNKIRMGAAAAADFAILLVLYVMTRPGGTPEAYKPVSEAAVLALCGALFLIYAAPIAWRASRTFNMLEIVQPVAATALAIVGTLQITNGEAAPAVGALCAILSSACYFTAFTGMRDLPRRNQNVFASWGIAFGLVACFLVLPQSLLVVIWGAAAVIATLAGARALQPTLAIHGSLYLLAAGIASGLPALVVNAFTGSRLDHATPALWAIFVSAACCYAVWGRSPGKVSLVPAIFAGFSLGTILILSLPLLAGEPGASVLATARTLVTCSAAVAFAFTGSRTGRRELVWIGYAALAVGSAKLLIEDFPQSRPAALAISLVCYGAALIGVSRLATGREAG